MTVQQEPVFGLFKALANATRFSIFQLLMTGMQCNCEISSTLEISLSLVSHHLHVLMDLGLVTAVRDETDARWVYFSIMPEALQGYRQSFLQLTDPDHIQERSPACGPKGPVVCAAKC